MNHLETEKNIPLLLKNAILAVVVITIFAIGWINPFVKAILLLAVFVVGLRENSEKFKKDLKDFRKDAIRYPWFYIFVGCVTAFTIPFTFDLLLNRSCLCSIKNCSFFSDLITLKQHVNILISLCSLLSVTWVATRQLMGIGSISNRLDRFYTLTGVFFAVLAAVIAIVSIIYWP